MLLQDLYQDIIVDHGKAPRHTGTLTSATHQMVGHNPLCGDRLTLYLVEQNGVICDARFDGTGCAISVASTSLMIEAILKKTLQEIEALFGQFHQLVVEGKTGDQDLGKLAAFSGVHHFPMRVKCATLAWHTLQAALKQEKMRVTTE